MEGGILLKVDAPVLEPSDRNHLEVSPESRLILIDSNWVKVPSLLRLLRVRGPMVERSLPPIQTAYPRRSKIFQDPGGGLATVEAMMAALAILGQPDFSLLRGYRWGEEFLESNREFFSSLGAFC